MLQAPVVGLLFGWSFHGKKSSEMGELLFMMAIAAIWFGATNSCREIASEWTIYRRERMVNLKIPSYVLSKMTVLAPFIFLQCLTLALIAKAMVPAVPCTILSVSGITFVGAMSACAMGLFLSSLLSSTEAAMGLVPIALIPQVLFAGVIIPWKDWQIRPLTALMASRWTLDALADASKAGYSRSISMASQVMDSTRISMFVRRELPSLGVFQDVTILALLGLAFTFLTFLSLKTKDIV
jgi:hypothetical protein